ncbi:MAG: hypothetical protein HFE36_03585 [Clostridia bacterium]|nr:hypothetical protein [Clostridia bacterium]
MAQKQFDEHLAKVILENCFPEKFSDLQISDKPDLRCGNNIGIEVTNCTSERVLETLNLFDTLSIKNEKSKTRSIERIEKLGAKCYTKNNAGTLMISYPGEYTNNIENSPSNKFLDAVTKKIKKLNNKNANYAKMASYELFVISKIASIPNFQIKAIFERLQQLNNKLKKYDRIYFLTNEYNLFEFNMINNTFNERILSSQINNMIDKTNNYLKEQNNE